MGKNKIWMYKKICSYYFAYSLNMIGSACTLSGVNINIEPFFHIRSGQILEGQRQKKINICFEPQFQNVIITHVR